MNINLNGTSPLVWDSHSEVKKFHDFKFDTHPVKHGRGNVG